MTSREPDAELLTAVIGAFEDASDKHDLDERDGTYAFCVCGAAYDADHRFEAPFIAAIAEAGRVLGERLRAEGNKHKNAPEAYSRGFGAALLNAAAGVESACGVASNQEGKQR